MKCPKCGAELMQGAKICRRCGAKLVLEKPCAFCQHPMPINDMVCSHCGKVQPIPHEEEPRSNFFQSPNMPNFVPQKKDARKRWLIPVAILGAFVIFFLGFAVGHDLAPNSQNIPVAPAESKNLVVSTTETLKPTKNPTPTPKPTPAAKKDDYIQREFDTSDCFFVNAELLYEYGEFLVGKKIVTVITVADTSIDLIKAKTYNNDGIFFSLNFKFLNADIPSAFEENDVLTISAIVNEKADLGGTITLHESTIIGTGEAAEVLSSNLDEQRAMCEQFKLEYANNVSAALANEREQYKTQCVTVDYTEVERNPDQYDGTYIAVSGSIEQVSEGWFDTVTLRVNSNGNMWYVNYSRKEGERRILEGDWITAYGKCTGVTSYTSLLGQQVTIPSMDMEYYE